MLRRTLGHLAAVELRTMRLSVSSLSKRQKGKCENTRSRAFGSIHTIFFNGCRLGSVQDRKRFGAYLESWESSQESFRRHRSREGRESRLLYSKKAMAAFEGRIRGSFSLWVVPWEPSSSPESHPSKFCHCRIAAAWWFIRSRELGIFVLRSF